jgi:putative N6-adenine-specific DNA methylase
MDKINLIATTGFGIEAVTARELKDLGYRDQMVENGRVTYTGDLNAICISNLWLRTAERVLLKIGEFKALSFEDLFQGTKALPWEDWIPVNATFPVEGKSVDSKLYSVSDCQAIVKKAVVERLKQRYNVEWFEETGPRYRIEVALLKDMVTLTIDTSGAGLHKRGYRKLVTSAPIKETMASALILLSYWKRDRVLWDPFCGSGTIPIEAALIGLNIAPGLNRKFDADEWDLIPEELWKTARKEAREKIDLTRKLRIHGTDIDEEVISLARHHAREAGVEEFIHLQKRAMEEIKSKYEHGIIITNPPYGERLSDEKEVEKLYKSMGKTFRELKDWSYYVITSYEKFEKYFGKKADKKRKLYNGRIECNYYQYFGLPPKKSQNNNKKL